MLTIHHQAPSPGDSCHVLSGTSWVDMEVIEPFAS